MGGSNAFIDTNILIYLLSSDTAKADRAEEIPQNESVISVQVLNEITQVARQKLSMDWKEIHEFLSLIKSLCHISPVTVNIHDNGRYLAERYQLSVYDAMIVAAALDQDCRILYSEDMHHGLTVEDRLTLTNPFVAK